MLVKLKSIQEHVNNTFTAELAQTLPVVFVTAQREGRGILAPLVPFVLNLKFKPTMSVAIPSMHEVRHPSVSPQILSKWD